MQNFYILGRLVKEPLGVYLYIYTQVYIYSSIFLLANLLIIRKGPFLLSNGFSVAAERNAKVAPGTDPAQLAELPRSLLNTHKSTCTKRATVRVEFGKIAMLILD